MNRYSVLVSAVTDEFGHYRPALRTTLTRHNVEVKVQEDFIESGADTLLKLDDYVQHCDGVIHLVGGMAGATPGKIGVLELLRRHPDLIERLPPLHEQVAADLPDLTYTQWEAWLALYWRKRLLIIRPAPGAPRDPRFRADENQPALQERHLKRLAQVGRYPSKVAFESVDSLLVAIYDSFMFDLMCGSRPPSRDALPADLRGRLDEFVDEYRGSERDPLRFAGREGELEQLRAWAHSADAPARMLVTGPMGRGKSAMLVRLWELLSATDAGDDLRVVFIPISLRFETHEPSVYMRMLGRSLAALAESQNSDIEDGGSVKAYETACRSAVQQLSQQRQRVLIIIDGIDEALGDAFAAHWFAPQPHSHVKLLLSARLQLGRESAAEWRTRLGWRQDAATLTLDPLDDAAARELLLVRGAQPLDLDAAVVQRLMELAQGEPLLLSLYAEDLWSSNSDNAIRLQDLSQIGSGFKGYFNRWMAKQSALWRAEGQHRGTDGEDHLRSILDVLSCAHGRLGLNGLDQVLRRFKGGSRPLRARESLEPLRRFVLGASARSSDALEGYVLAHPALATYFVAELPPDQAARIRRAFVDWGLAEIGAARSATNPNVRIDPYVVAHYVQHVRDVWAPIEEHAVIYCSTWRQARAARDGSLRGYIEDLRQVAEFIVQQRMPNRLSQLLRVRLLETSAREASNMPVSLMLAGVEHGWIQPQAALHGLDSIQSLRLWKMILGLAPRFPIELRREMIVDALSEARRGDRDNLAIALATLSTHVPVEQQSALRFEALEALSRPMSMNDFLRAVDATAPHLDAPGRLHLLETLLVNITESWNWDLLGYLLPHVPEPERWTVLQRVVAFEQMHRPSGKWNREESLDPGSQLHGDLLAVVYRYLPAELKEKLRDAALLAARTSSSNYCKVMGLAGIVAGMPLAVDDALLQEALSAARAESGWADEVHLTSHLAASVPAGLRAVVLSRALDDSCRTMRARGFSQSARFAHMLDESALQRCLEAALDCQRLNRAHEFEDLAPYLNREQIRLALTSMERFNDRREHLVCLLTIICRWPELRYLDPDLSIEAVVAGHADSIRSDVYAEVARNLQPHSDASIVRRGLRQWLIDLRDPAFKSPGYVLSGLVPLLDRSLDALVTAAREQGWDEAGLSQALDNVDLAREASDPGLLPPPPQDLDGWTEEQIEQDRVASNALWSSVDAVRQHLASKPDSFDAFSALDYIDRYPQSLQRQVLETIIRSLARGGRDYFVRRVDLVAKAIHTIEGVEGVKVVCDALRESMETFS